MFGKNSKVDAVASSVMQVIEKVTTDTLKGREDGSINSYTPAKVTLKGDVEKKPDPKEPEETTAMKSHKTHSVSEELKGNQDKLDKNHNGKLDSQDFKILRGKKKSTNEAFVQKLKDSAKKVLAKVGGGSDEDMKKDLQKKMGIPQTGKVGMAKQNEETVEEGWDDMLKDVADKKKPQPNGGSGVKKGNSYGNQKPEKEVKEGVEGSAEDKDEDKKEAKKRHMSMKQWEKSAADKKHDMKEAKTLSPGQDDSCYSEPSGTTPKEINTPMSRAKNLARAAMDKVKKDHKLG